MLPYYLLFSFFSAGSLFVLFRRDAVLKVYLAFSFFVLLLFVGLRYDSTDYYTYFGIYNYISDFRNLGFFLYTPEDGSKPHESLFSLLIILVKEAGFGFYQFIFVFALVSLLPKLFCFYKMSALPALSLVLYCSLWLIRDLGQMRSGMAGGFILLSLYYIFNSSYLKYLFYTYLASVSHTVGSVGLLAMAFTVLKSRIFAFSVLVCLYAFSFFGGFSSFFIAVLQEVLGLSDSSRLVRYSLTHRVEGYSPVGGTVLMHLILSLALLYFYNELSRINKYNSFLILVFVYGFSFMLLFVDYGIVFYRIRDVLVMPVMVTLLPSFVFLFKSFDRVLAICGVIALSFILFLLYLPAKDYKSILFEIPL